MKWIVPADQEDARADRVLARLSGSSRAAAKAALESGAVTVDGAEVPPSFRVGAGSEFEGDIAAPATVLEPEPVPFGIRYEDEHMAIVDKPAGVVTHPGAGNATGTLAAGLLHRWPSIHGVGSPGRWGIVHRLDRDTSGLLVVALTVESHAALGEAIRNRRVTREYLALVEGEPDAATGTIDAPIARDPRRPTRMRVHPDGRRSVTHFRAESTHGGSTLLRVTLETGRTHQIRVHLAGIGLPVAGDRVYGNGRGSPRLFLHATRLALEHPSGGAWIDVTSPLPDDLAAALAEVDDDR